MNKRKKNTQRDACMKKEGRREGGDEGEKDDSVKSCPFSSKNTSS